MNLISPQFKKPELRVLPKFLQSLSLLLKLEKWKETFFMVKTIFLFAPNFLFVLFFFIGKGVRQQIHKRRFPFPPKSK